LKKRELGFPHINTYTATNFFSKMIGYTGYYRAKKQKNGNKNKSMDSGM